MNVNGKWLQVAIVDKESEYLYKVHYTGLSDSADEWIPLNQLKNIDSSAPVITLPKEERKITSAVNCVFNAPVGAVGNAESFSEKVAKRKIYEWLVAKNANSFAKTGVSYLYYQSGQPYANTVSVTSKGLLLQNAAAPAGAMVYPVSVKYRICTQEPGKTISSTVADGKFSCFRNEKGLWACRE